MKPQDIVIRYDNDLTLRITDKVVEIQTFTMFMTEFAPYKLDDTDFIWSVNLDELNGDLLKLYNDFITTTESSVELRLFSQIISAAKILSFTL